MIHVSPLLLDSFAFSPLHLHDRRLFENNIFLDNPRASTTMAPTIPGGERAITDMHGWNQQNGPGKVFHDLLISSACQVLYGEYQNGNNAGLTAQAVHNIWNHPQLTPLWNRNSEDELKATIRALVAHRRHKFAGGLRRDWPANVPQPPFQWFMQINNGAAGAGQNGALQRQIPVSDMVVIVKRRYGNFFGRMFAIRVVELLPQGEDTVTDFSMLDFNTLIHYLNQDQCFALNAQTETLVWTDEDGHDMPIDRQFAFEAALQMQYNSGVKNMKLEVVSKFITSVITATILQAHLLTQF